MLSCQAKHMQFARLSDIVGFRHAAVSYDQCCSETKSKNICCHAITPSHISKSPKQSYLNTRTVFIIPSAFAALTRHCVWAGCCCSHCISSGLYHWFGDRRSRPLREHQGGVLQGGPAHDGVMQDDQYAFGDLAEEQHGKAGCTSARSPDACWSSCMTPSWAGPPCKSPFQSSWQWSAALSG